MLTHLSPQLPVLVAGQITTKITKKNIVFYKMKKNRAEKCGFRSFIYLY